MKILSKFFDFLFKSSLCLGLFSNEFANLLLIARVIRALSCFRLFFKMSRRSSEGPTDSLVDSAAWVDTDSSSISLIGPVAPNYQRVKPSICL